MRISEYADSRSLLLRSRLEHKRIVCRVQKNASKDGMRDVSVEKQLE